MWVFDDPRVGLVQEPFVAGADTMIDRVVADIPDAERGFTMIFSTTPFPGHQHRLDWRREGSSDRVDRRIASARDGICGALAPVGDCLRERRSLARGQAQYGRRG